MFFSTPFQPVVGETPRDTAAREWLIKDYRLKGFSSEAARLEAGMIQPHDIEDMKKFNPEGE